MDPSLGADGGGNTFPGSTLQFGKLKAGPETGGNNSNSGWTAQLPINGFSQTHVSGTGGGPKYGNILVQPTSGEITPADIGSLRDKERATAGFYSVKLTRYDVDVETASARRSDGVRSSSDRRSLWRPVCRYLWAKRPDGTQSHIPSILAKNYHAGPMGLPGNDDSGAMSSWYAFGKMGFCPNAAQDVYLIGIPAYRRTSIALANGRKFVIATVDDVAADPYIASATWNGHPYNRAWFTHEELVEAT